MSEEEVIASPASPATIEKLSEINAQSTRISNEDDLAEAPLWLITFTDIMALMLTFFVLLYSMSIPEVDKWEELTSSINEGFSKFYSPEQFAGIQDTISIDKIDRSEALNLDYLRALIEEKIEENETLNDIVIITGHDKLIISMPENLLFEAGQNEVKTEGKRALFALGGLLARIRNRIEVVGHSDPRPITRQNAKFSSNWELSLARAASVSSILKQVGYRRGMITRGMSSARYDEIPKTVPEEKRLDLSRRVDLVVLEVAGSS